jgi:iron complex outermembrane receptor protein
VRFGRVVLAAFVCAFIFDAWPESANADVRTEARRHFRRGMELVQQGQLDPGVEELELAYEILPHPNVLYNIGRAYAEAGHYDEAVIYFERYLLSDPPDREEVQGFIAALEERMGTAAQASATETGSDEPRVATVPGTAPTALHAADVTEEQLQTIRESADHIDAMAEATNSDVLRARAARLRQLAETLESEAEASTAGASRAATSGRAGAGEGEGAFAVGSERTGVFDETVVSASRFAESPLDAPNSTTIITAQDIRLSGITDLPQLLRRAAGVDVITHTPGHTDVAIRGLATRQANKVLVLLNGRTLRIDFLGSPFLEVLPFSVYDIERIEVIRGPAAAVYGADAFSGIVNIILRDAGDGRSRARVAAGNGGILEVDSSVTGRVDRLSYRFGAGYRQMDNYTRLIDPNRVDLHAFLDDTNQGVQTTYANGEIRYTFGAGNVLRVGSMIDTGDVSIMGVGLLQQMLVKDVVFSQTYAQLNTRFGLGARVYWNALHANVDQWASPVGSLDAQGTVRQDVVDVQLDWNREFVLLFPHNFTIGGGYRFKGATMNWFADGHITENHGFVFIQDAMRLHERLRATISLRADRHPLLGFNLSPRGSIVYRFMEGQSMRLTAGTSYRSPSFIESYVDFANRTPIRGATAYGRGNKGLDAEQMISLEVGYQNQATDYFALEANFYFNIVRNEIQLNRVDQFTLSDFARGSAAFDDVNAAFPLGSTTFQNQPTDFRQLGGEVGVRVFPVTGLDLYANYATNDTRALSLDQLPEAQRGERRTPRHKVNFGVQYRSGFGLDLSMDLSWVSGRRWIEQVEDTTTGIRFVPFDVPAYTLLNARVGYRLIDDRLELAITGFNLLHDVHREHPFGQPIDTRVIGSTTVYF